MSKKAAIPAVLALSFMAGGVLPTTAPKVYAEETQVSATTPEEVALAYLQSQVLNTARSFVTTNQFQIVNSIKDSTTNTYHVRTIEQYKGIPIYGSGQAVALDANNNVYAAVGNVTQNLSRSVIPTEAAIAKEDAESIAKTEVEASIGAVNNYDGIETELTILPKDGQHRLTYLVKLSTSIPAPGYFHYFVDATTGEVLEHFNAAHEAIDPANVTPITGTGLDVFGKKQSFISVKNNADGKNYLYGGAIAGGTLTNPNIVPVATFDARRMPETSFILLSALFGFTGFEVRSNTSFFADPAAVSAHTNSIKINQYYQSVHKRNGIDNKAMPMISTVHIGSKWNNAAWNGKQMLYGDGDGVLLGSLAGGLDVAGHEITHGVIEKTANLTYQDESGAINESLADIFGELAELYAGGITVTPPDAWEMGEDIYTPNKLNDGGLRSMSNPKTKSLSAAYGLKDNKYPDTYADRYIGTLDKGGVHINSSINNKAAYLIAAGGTHNGVTVTGITRQKMEKIYYRALTLYLTPSSGFKEMRQAAIQSARDLYPDNRTTGQPSTETKAVIAAYDAVGVPAE
ncbi:M4 family metallopeptidase [Ectobacillus sp. JY-23]|uniref:M4 family metallopeptidase n=1 Tax=Ectobacillus sp. JY-23 TaxID=2933872 RepID=UPI001FF4297B|nr:M4 family metallopeptidase [Ectobacillus sp. JY-23]UOY94445.1 M4 family metallopeptidase [Ectobacillus sp. JY-23]